MKYGEYEYNAVTFSRKQSQTNTTLYEGLERAVGRPLLDKQLNSQLL